MARKRSQKESFSKYGMFSWGSFVPFAGLSLVHWRPCNAEHRILTISSATTTNVWKDNLIGLSEQHWGEIVSNMFRERSPSCVEPVCLNDDLFGMKMNKNSLVPFLMRLYFVASVNCQARSQFRPPPFPQKERSNLPREKREKGYCCCPAFIFACPQYHSLFDTFGLRFTQASQQQRHWERPQEGRTEQK